MFDRRIVRIGNQIRSRATFRYPLMGTGRALREFPFKTDQVLEEGVALLCRSRRPDTFETACDGMGSHSTLIGARPTEALCRDTCAGRFNADMCGSVRRAVSLAKGVTAGDQRNGFIVVHRHPAERLAD